MCDCLFDTFRSSPFVLDKFISLSNIFIQPDQLSTPGDHTVDIIKSKVIARLLMKTFVSAALTKSQIDTMNKCIKAILVFTSPKNEPIAKRIHAGYLSCRRESLKEHNKRDLHVEKCFAACKYFSLAIDTALFR